MSNIAISFWERFLPETVRRQDPRGALRALVDAIQEQADVTAGEALALLTLIDPDSCPPQFLPYLAGHLSLRLYHEDPVDLQRYQVSRYVDFLKFKGTVKGFEILARLLGYEGQVISLFEDAPDGNKFLAPAPGLAMSSDVILVFNEIVDGQFRRLTGNENGALTPEFIERLLGRIEDVRPIHINVFGIRVGKTLVDTVELSDDCSSLGVTTKTCVDWIACEDHWHGRCSTRVEGVYTGPWDTPGYEWDALIYDDKPERGLRYYWDTMNLPLLGGHFLRRDNSSYAKRDGQTILDRDDIDEWDEPEALWDESLLWDVNNSSPFVHGPYDVTARHDACGYDSDPLQITARGLFGDEFGPCVFHNGEILRDRTGRIIYDRSGRNYDQCDPAEIYIRNVNCPELSHWDCDDETWWEPTEYFWDEPSFSENDPYLLAWDGPHSHEVYWDREPRRAPEPNDHWDALPVPYRQWDDHGLDWDELQWDDPWVIWDDPEENEFWDGFTILWDDFQTVYNWDNPNPYSYWDDGDLHWDLPGLEWDEGLEEWDDGLECVVWDSDNMLWLWDDPYEQMIYWDLCWTENFHWDGYCGPYFLWDDPEEDFAWDEYVVIWDDQEPVACGFVPN